MIIITCKKAFAQTSCRTAILTAGMSKAETVRFVFSDDWDGLSKTAVFTDGVKTVDVLPSGWDGDTVTIPHEILTTAGRTARVGVYGTNASGVVLPTVWVTLGKVQPAAEPSGDPSTDPTLPVWAQLQEIIGDLNNLTTKAKENLVAAINEAAKTGSGGAGSIDLRTADGYIQYSNDGGETWENLIALTDLKGEKGDTGETGPRGPQGETGPAGPQGKTGPAGQDGAPGKDGSPGKDGTDGAPGQDGFSPSASVAETATGATITITDKTGTTTAEIKNGKDGAPGKDGTNGKDGAPGADGAPGTPGANGTDGKDGTTFTPSVSAAGDLSWTNDGGKANPAPVNLKGPQGETGPQGPQGPAGKTPVKGTDYFTQADKQEIAEDAAALVDLSGKQNKITASGILKGDGAGGVEAATPGTDYLTEAPVTSVNGATGEVKSTFYVAVTQGDDGSVTADKTAAEVYAAYAAGYAVYAVTKFPTVNVAFELPLVSAAPFFETFVLGFGALGSLDPTANPQYPTVAYTGTNWFAWLGTLAKKSDIPTALKNPNALNIKIGDTTTTYDGSAAETVEIPKGVPSVTTADNGKILRVVNGAWAAAELLSAGGVSF